MVVATGVRAVEVVATRVAATRASKAATTNSRAVVAADGDE